MIFDATASSIWKPRFDGSVADWCEQHLIFDEAGNHGPFSTIGAEYTREVLEDFARSEVSDEVLVWGSQTRKTGTMIGGVAWCLVNDPCGFLWVLPNIDLARRFSRQRWKKLIERSAVTAELIPRGAKRHAWSTREQVLRSSAINFVGSNAASGLASSPCRRVILDEVEKFHESPEGEADAVNLAEQRTKNQNSPQRWKTSTPALPTGLIWREYLKGNQRRYHIPCPHCSQFVTLAWSPQYSILPRLGNEAYIFWDPEAKRDGSWNYDQVAASAYALCPHCKGKITDGDKRQCIAKGKWIATEKSQQGFVSRHLSSLYSTATDCQFGRLAVKFIKSKASIEGVQGFVNGDLAEPYVAQDSISARSPELTRGIEVSEDGWSRIMTIDCQQKSPHFWYVVRAWADSKSTALASGSCETWDDLDEIQKANKVYQRRMVVDSGFGARSEADVYGNCASRCDIWTKGNDVIKVGGLRGIIGWWPSKGLPGRRKWKDSETQTYLPYFLRSIDPFLGTDKAGKYGLQVLEFSSDLFSDILETLSENRKRFLWSVNKEAGTETYWKHWESEIKTMTFSRKTNRASMSWQLRAQRWPNHLRDCEKMQVAAAAMFGYLPLDP